jgi:LmbE family N-acetylglucosaminyl deacetylase
MTSKDKIIVIATHPDDETYGAGGSLMRFKAEGAEIFWLIVTNVHTEHGWSEDVVVNRQDEIKRVAQAFPFDGVYNLNLPTTKLDQIPRGDLISAISKVFAEVKPTHLILPFYGDPHSDHRIAFECAFTCTKTFRYPYLKNIWMMEVLSETDFGLPGAQNAFLPNVFVNVSDFVEAKIEALKIFKSELGEHPFPRSVANIKALATLRGAQAGCTYAEAFMNVKTII